MNNIFTVVIMQPYMLALHFKTEPMEITYNV
jgi:hypothetical protein